MKRLKLNDEFHIMLCGFSGNELLGSYLSQTMRLLHRGMAQHMLEESRIPESAHSIHHQVVEALEARDREKALRYLKEDIYSMEKELWEVIV
jgi:DNA-binding GntR family transcriptional regulator